MFGPVTNSVFIITGSVMGSVCDKIIPPRLRRNIMYCFSCLTLGIGASMTAKVNALPAVVVALLAGMIIGEGFSLESRVMSAALRVSGLLRRKDSAGGALNDKAFRDQFAVGTVLFCMSGLGIMGSMREGLTGDASLLYIKSLLDLPTAMLLAASTGAVLAVLALPQLLLQMVILLVATAVVPLITPAMLGDFSACGGIIMIGAGLRQCSLLEVPILSMLPALFLVMPVSALWQRFMGA
jgi:uncharacterized membrane protein YqgA involved in biofilm formation